MEPSYPSYSPYGNHACPSAPGGYYATPLEQPFVTPSQPACPTDYASYSPDPCHPTYGAYCDPVPASPPCDYAAPLDQPYVAPSEPAAYQYPSSSSSVSAEYCDGSYSAACYQEDVMEDADYCRPSY